MCVSAANLMCKNVDIFTKPIRIFYSWRQILVSLSYLMLYWRQILDSLSYLMLYWRQILDSLSYLML
jgi:hypothetical protein